MWIKKIHSPHSLPPLGRGLTVVEIIVFLLHSPKNEKIIYSSSCCSKTLRYSKHKLPKIGFVFSQHIYPFIKVHTTIIFTLLKVQKDIIIIWHDFFIWWFNLGFHSWINIDQHATLMLAWGMRTSDKYTSTMYIYLPLMF